MPSHPALDEFRRQVQALRKHPLLKDHISRGGEARLDALTLDHVAAMIREKDQVAYYFLIGAAGLNRTSLKQATEVPEAQLVQKVQRKAYAIRARLPVRAAFDALADRAVTLREVDLKRRTLGGIEQLFRDRLRDEGIPIAMSPPVRQVPTLLVARRKPDGVYPDPATGQAPRLYLEIKNLRRVSDDIQKRLYEIVEASLEVKLLYGTVKLQGLGVRATRAVLDAPSEHRARMRAQIIASEPVVVALLLCPRADAERYREGAQAFVDRVFFQEEIDDCVAFLKATIAGFQPSR